MDALSFALIYGLIWAAVACYVAALRLDLLAPSRDYEPRARAYWLAGAWLAAVHVAVGFHFVHHWSLDHAYVETAQRTTRFLAAWGVDNPGDDGRRGVFMALGFIALWLIDASVRWFAPTLWLNRPWWIAAAVHGYLGFIIFNATVVFGSYPARLAGVFGIVILCAAWRRRLAQRASAALPSPA